MTIYGINIGLQFELPAYSRLVEIDSDEFEMIPELEIKTVTIMKHQ
jgi:hypothetical protein